MQPQSQYNSSIDLTVATNIMLADGIGRQGIGLIQCVADSLNVNAMQLPPCNYKDVPLEVQKVLLKGFSGYGKITFWTYILGLGEKILKIHQSIKSPIKMAFSMFESDGLPDLWVSTINSYYDMVVVPDPWLIQPYQKVGVKKPIFVVPLGIMIENLLNKPFKEQPGTPFTFGISAGFWERKNHIKTLQAFASKFGNNPNFLLKLHGRFGSFQPQVEKAVKEANLNNVELISQQLSPQEYDQFMDSIDCYVFPSKGEGFSITPREALALGRPCILSQNTAHTTINQTGFTLPLNCPNKIPAYYEIFSKNIGIFHDCQVEDIATSMQQVVDDYSVYAAQAQKGREWVKQYLWSSLKPTYLSLFQPKPELSKENKITPDSFQTNNKELYHKLKEVFK